MDGPSNQAAICAARKASATLLPIIVISATILLIAATIFYAEDPRGPYTTIKSRPAMHPRWSDQAAATVTAAIMDRRHPERPSPQFGPTGFFYTAD